jgi:hypothetical protein
MPEVTTPRLPAFFIFKESIEQEKGDFIQVFGIFIPNYV